MAKKGKSKRTYKGHHEWTVAEKRLICLGLAKAGWDGSTRGLKFGHVGVYIEAVAKLFRVRLGEQLCRQVSAAIVRGREEDWAKEWRTAWRAACRTI